ncbi:MAG: radical SAM protein [Thermoplasmata archaeon]|nr:radical SAM protein [Thermoplasmata archaeon]
MTKGPLPRYRQILEGEAEARYLLTKRTTVDVDLKQDAESLWQVHDSVTSEEEPTGKTSLLDLKVELSKRMLKDCTFCERVCHVDRSSGHAGHCGVLEPMVSSEFLHMGEEPELIPSHTIFLSGCTFDCVYCQNHDISTNPLSGMAIPPELLSRRIEQMASVNGNALRPARAHARSVNVNWVGGDPTSSLPFILETLSKCETNLPQIWNSNMYLTEQAMRLLDGVVDVYLTDFKYGNDGCAKRLSNVDGYMSAIKRNHLLARSQAEMIVRHLVLPSHIECCTRPGLTWIAENLERVKVNVMGQYRPAHKAGRFDEISCPLSMSEYRTAIEIARGLGLDLCD